MRNKVSIRAQLLLYVISTICASRRQQHNGQLTSNQITLERNFLWDVIKIEWEEVFLTLNGAIVQLPISVKIPLRDKFRLRHMMSKRSLLLHVMLRQGSSWYALDNIEYLLPPPYLEESEL